MKSTDQRLDSLEKQLGITPSEDMSNADRMKNIEEALENIKTMDALEKKTQNFLEGRTAEQLTIKRDVQRYGIENIPENRREIEKVITTHALEQLGVTEITDQLAQDRLKMYIRHTLKYIENERNGRSSNLGGRQHYDSTKSNAIKEIQTSTFGLKVVPILSEIESLI